MKEITEQEALELGRFVVIWQFNGQLWSHVVTEVDADHIIEEHRECECYCGLTDSFQFVNLKHTAWYSLSEAPSEVSDIHFFAVGE